MKKLLLASALFSTFLGMSQTVTTVSGDDPTDPVPFAVIENVPEYPGCKGTNEELKNCMSEKINAHVSKNFDMKKMEKLELSSGVQRISVQFKVGRDGKVVDVRARAPHPEVEKEAVRVIELLPTMKPGKQKGKDVGVLYALPIIFKVEKEQKKSDAKGGL